MCAWSAMHGEPIGPAGPVAPDRREWLQRSALIVAWLGAGLGVRDAHASRTLPFDATLLSDVLRAMGGRPTPTPSIELDLPDLSEDGAMVPVAVTSRVPGTEQITLLAEANPYPLVFQVDVAPGTEAYVSTRVKLARSCTVMAVVRADGRLYSTTRVANVTLGGCGG